MKIGFIGLGNMGKPMAKNILQAGYSLMVNDINKTAVQEIEALGAQKADSPADLAGAVDVLITMLPNEDIVRQVVTGSQGILTAGHKGLVIMDMSSVSPDFSKEMAGLAAEYEVKYIDAPVSGGVKGAENGTLTIMVGGMPETVEMCRPILAVLGTKLYEVGDIGAGDAVKMINNMLLAVNMAAVAEAFVLGNKIGLDPQKLFEVIKESSGNSYALQMKLPNFIFKGEFAPGFTVDLQHKDLELVVRTAKKNQVPLLLANHVQQLYGQLQAAGLGKEDISAIIKPMEALTGTKVRCS